MTTYSTGNPLGSSDPRDLYDNAENLDNLVNGGQPAYNDRLGKSRRSWQSVEDQVNAQAAEFSADQTQRDSEFSAAQSSRDTTFTNFLNSSGFEYLGEYAAGITFTEYNQYVVSAGEAWFIDPTTPLPYVTTGAGVPEGGALMSRGEAVLRQEIGSGIRRVDTLAGLHAITGRFSGDAAYMVGRTTGGDGGEGEFRWDASDLSAEVDADTLSGLYVAPASDPSGMSGAWVRMYSGAINVLWFGVQFGVDESTKISSIASLISDGDSLYFPHGDYVFADPSPGVESASFQNISGITVFGDRATVTQPVESGTGRAFTRKTLFFYNCKNVKVSGLTFVGNHANGDSETSNNHQQAAISVFGCSSVLIEGCDAEWFNRGFISQESDQVRIINCKAENTFNGFLANYSDDVKIDMCVAKDSRYGPTATTVKSIGYGFLSNYSKNTIFSSCISYRAGSECFRAQGDSTHENIFFNNCISILSQRYAFSSRGSHGLVQFNNCIVKDAGDPIFWDNTDPYREPSPASVVAFLADSPKVSLYGCSVDITNTLSPSSGDGYGVFNTETITGGKLVIGNSSFNLPGGFYGAYSRSLALHIYDTEIVSQGRLTPFWGVEASSASTRPHSIRGCTITGFRDGIRLGAYGSTVTGNIIRGTGRHGINSSSSAAIITENSISDVGLDDNGAGIEVSSGSGAIISNNNIENTVATPTVTWGIFNAGGQDIIFGRNRIVNFSTRIRNDVGDGAFGTPLFGKSSLVDESTATDVAGIVSDFNDLIAKLKASDLMDRQ